jgi:hypothetical protein
VRLERPAIRVLAASGEEQWQIALDSDALYAADLAFSPDGRLLAYLVMPHGDGHTLDEALLPKAGLYLADLAGRSTRFLHPCFGDAIAWGPGATEITIAARSGDFWSTRYVGLVVRLSDGQKMSEFSLPGAVAVVAYSEDAQWLAVQAQRQGDQGIWIYARSAGWGHQLDLGAEKGSGLALLGWARLPPEVVAPSASKGGE